MSTFDAMLARHAARWVDPKYAPVIDAIYNPRNGAARPIKVQAHYEIPESNEDDQGAVVSGIRVLVVNSNITGISSAELNRRADTITMPQRQGDDPTALPIIDIISQDAGMVYLQVAPSL